MNTWVKPRNVFEERDYRVYLEKKYGITSAQWDRVLEKQDNCCAICCRKMRLVPDHDHKTGRFRGALCMYCNGILGKIEKHPVILENIREYLNASSAKAATA